LLQRDAKCRGPLTKPSEHPLPTRLGAVGSRAGDDMPGNAYAMLAHALPATQCSRLRQHDPGRSTPTS